MDLSENKNQINGNNDIDGEKKRTRSRQRFKNKKKQSNLAIEVLVTTLKMFVLLILVVAFAAFGAVLGIGKAYLDSTPELDIAKIEDQSETSFIYDKDGNLITEYFGFENRVWAPIEEIPKTLRNAFIAVEDVRFYSHKGIDYRRMIGAFVNNLKNDSVQGASTITQQLIKNSILSPERTYKRKIQEMYLAIQLEKKYDKDQILEAYLNTIHLGGSNYGVKVAAKDYFGKELDELTLRECAILAGTTQNPSKFDPRRNLLPISSGGRGTPEWTYKRTNIVLKAMYENEYITKEEYEEAKFDENNLESEKNQVHIIKESQSKQLYPMPYFIEYVIYDVRDKIMEQKDWKGDEGRNKAEQLIYGGGLKIYTTVDPDIQETMENVIYNYENLPQLANPDKYSVSSQGVPQPQVAAVIMDQSTGEIRGVVGGKQPPTQHRQLNRAFMSKLPLGSSMKPLAVYAPFIEAGYPGGIIFENIKAPIEGWQSKNGYPQNYEGGGYTGPTDVRTGIKRSLNVVSARIVADRIGPQYSANKLIELGIDEEDIPGYTNGSPSPAALALGTHGNNMVEITAAFATIANKGVYQEPISFTKVLDKNDKEILNTSNQITRSVFKESTTFILTDWMEDAVNNGTGGKARFNNSMPVAGKTGTNSDFRGVYFAGFTPYYTGAVWIGHDDFQPSFVRGSTGGAYAAPLWGELMKPIHEELESVPFYESVPEDVVKVTVCGVSGLLPNEDLCAHDSGGHGLVTEYFPKDAVPTETCNIHRKVTLCNVSGKYPTPYCPESELTTKSVVILPENSPYRLLPDAELQKYLPGALKNFLGPDELDYNNPKYTDYFCPIHTKEWKETKNEKDVLRQQAQELLDKVKKLLENPGFKKKMTPDEKKQLEAALTKLEEVLKKSEVSGDSETQAIQPSDIKKAMDELSQTANSILNRIENSTPTMQPNDDEDEDNNKNRNDDNNNDNKGDKGDKGDKKDNNDNNDDENKNNEDPLNSNN